MSPPPAALPHTPPPPLGKQPEARRLQFYYKICFRCKIRATVSASPILQPLCPNSSGNPSPHCSHQHTQNSHDSDRSPSLHCTFTLPTLPKLLSKQKTVKNPPAPSPGCSAHRIKPGMEVPPAPPPRVPRCPGGGYPRYVAALELSARRRRPKRGETRVWVSLLLAAALVRAAGAALSTALGWRHLHPWRAGAPPPES
jgi:hypothetical protein